MALGGMGAGEQIHRDVVLSRVFFGAVIAVGLGMIVRGFYVWATSDKRPDGS